VALPACLLKRANISHGAHTRCESCLLLQEWCLCDRVPRLEIQTQLIIIRHWKERLRTSNTARMVQAAIPSTVILDYGAPGAELDPTTLPLSEASLLFPGETAQSPAFKTLIIVDGSWPQARRMVQRIPGLASLPKTSVSPLPVPPRRLRRPPQPEGMATIEAVARALDRLEGPGTGAPLDLLFNDMVETMNRLRGRP
jgi:DTW domain-containing protein YfiP